MRSRLSLLVALTLSACAAPTVERKAAPAVATLPPIELATLDGKPAQLADAVAGKVAVISLWATWCEACATEFDALGRLHDRAGAYNAVVIAVAVGEPRQTVAEFVRARGLRWPQLVDEGFRFADALGQKRVPATLVLDRRGRVVYSGGALDESALEAFRTALN
jgi:peroxiredoxin